MDIQCEREMVACNADGASVFFGRREMYCLVAALVFMRKGGIWDALSSANLSAEPFAMAFWNTSRAKR